MGPIERVARRSQYLLFAFAIFLLCAGLGLAAAAFCALMGFWIPALEAFGVGLIGAGLAWMVVISAKTRPPIR